MGMETIRQDLMLYLVVIVLVMVVSMMVEAGLFSGVLWKMTTTTPGSNTYTTTMAM
jgi:hypothetical protein